MGKASNNSMFKHLLVLCLSITLLLAQAGKLHVHLENNDHSEPSAHVHVESSSHVLGVHPESTPHDFGLLNHHDNHSAAAVDVSPEKLLKSTGFINPLAIILLFIGLFLFIPRRASVCRPWFDKTFFPRCYYLLQPPLRAPPVK